MPIICLEGASSVGKSSTARVLADDFDAYVVAETAFLFERPNVVSGSADELKWFLDCNMKRWQIAIEQSKTHDLVVLDGDHIKLWYDWVYGIEPRLFNFCVHFYAVIFKTVRLDFLMLILFCTPMKMI